MKNKVILFVLAITLSVILGSLAGDIYSKFYTIPRGFSAFILPRSWNYNAYGFVLTYILLISFFYSVISRAGKLLVILLIPAFIFEITFDFQHIYIPIILALLGWGIGIVVSRLIPQKKQVL